MLSLVLEREERLEIRVPDVTRLKGSAPEVLEWLVADAAAVNARYVRDGAVPPITLTFW